MSDTPTRGADVNDGNAAATAVLRLLRAHLRRHVPLMVRTLHETGLSMPQMATLHFLHAEGPQPISGIAAHLNLSLTATSHSVQRLVSKGLVTRAEDPQDRRRKAVALAEGGGEVVAQAHRRAAAALDELLAAVPAERREALERAVSDVMAAVEGGR